MSTYIMEITDSVIETSVKVNNSFLEYNYLRIILLLVTGVFMGYTLQPVPKWLNNMFDTSHTLKFFVLFIAGCIAVYPVNKNNIMWVFIGSIGTLYLFHLFRLYDAKLEKEKVKDENKKN